MKTRQPIEARFWSKVDRRGPDECWPWLASAGQDGRGYFFFRGKVTRAPRVAFELASGAAPNDLVCHSCDNPNCVNPAHLWDGTHSDNVRDAIAKGRSGWQTGVQRPRGPANKRFCPSGHEYTAENSAFNKHGHKYCRQCKRANWRRWYARRAAASPNLFAAEER